MIKSSAYNREFSFAPFGKTKGSDNVFSNAKGRSLIYKDQKTVDLRYSLAAHLSQ